MCSLRCPRGVSKSRTDVHRHKNIVHTRSVIIFSNACVKARDASSRWSSIPQFLDNDSASESAYNCTLGLRCARRLSTAATTFRALLAIQSHDETDRERSHVPLLALILDLVAQIQDQLPVLASKILICGLVCDERGECCGRIQVSCRRILLTDDIIVGVCLTRFEHCRWRLSLVLFNP